MDGLNYSKRLVAILMKNYHFQCVCVLVAQLCPTLCDPMDYSPQAPLSMGFFRQEYWSGLPCPPPRDLADPGFEPTSLSPPVLGGEFFTTRVATWEALQEAKYLPFSLWKGHDPIHAFPATA